MLGLTWGGEAPTERLLFRAGEAEEPVTVCPEHRENRSWTLWVHAWVPSTVGEFTLSMAVDDPEVSTTRLDLGWDDRVVTIDAV